MIEHSRYARNRPGHVSQMRRLFQPDRQACMPPHPVICTLGSAPEFPPRRDTLS